MSRSLIGSLFLAFPTYLVVSTLWFSDPLSPLALVLLWPDRLGLPYWRLSIPVGVAAAAILVFWVFRPRIHRVWWMPAFVAASISLSVVSIGLYVELRRQVAISRFGADEVVRSSFFRSIREAPREFQFFLHAAALKNCKAYAWSYRRMAFYELPPNIGANVLPAGWIAKCAIKRDGEH